MASVVARATYRIAGKGQARRIAKGKIYDANNPVVRANPSLFLTPEEAARKAAKPRSTAELGRRSMSARKTETSRQKPGEPRSQAKAD